MADRDRASPALAALIARHTAGYRTVGEVAYETIKQAINTGVLAPGERLRQRTLAQALGVSRISVRSALIKLESEGLIANHPGRGSVVRRLSAAQVNEICRLRHLLESYALRLATTSITAARIARLRVLARRVDEELEDIGFSAVRSEFYRLLYDAERNSLLVKLIDELRAMVESYLLRLRVAYRYAELVEFVANGDSDGALGWLNEHLNSVREAVMAIVTAADQDRPDDALQGCAEAMWRAGECR